MNKLAACAAVVVLSAVTVAYANPDVTSREYKLMLDATSFHYSSEATDVDDFLNDAEVAIEAAIARDVTGSQSLDKVRDVSFFDTEGMTNSRSRGWVV